MRYNPIKVLLVEDKPGDTRLICEMLSEVRDVQIDVECVDRLSSGLECLAVGGIDVLLLDLSLPDGQGLDVCVRAHAQAESVPIVVLTGLDDETMAAKTLQIGAQDYLVKGQVDSGLLLRSIRYAIERKQAEEKAHEAEALRELDRLRTELLSNVSHELRTPLATIKGYSTMLLDYDMRLRRDEKRRYLRFIDRATGRLVELIDQLLDMSRLESGLIEMNTAPTNISRLIREVVSEAHVRKPQRQLVLDLPQKLPKLTIDARHIQQVLDNLIDNAIKYSGEDTEVVVSARQVDHEVLVSVVDQGIGIPAEELPKVFDRMYRTRRRRVTKIAGAGLGLPICKRLIEAHGSKIWIESEEGKGTACFFTLPLGSEENGNGGEV
jgi:sigma-B regulation protein RsbU (phosphoserine phosphatase)